MSAHRQPLPIDERARLFDRVMRELLALSAHAPRPDRQPQQPQPNASKPADKRVGRT